MEVMMDLRCTVRRVGDYEGRTEEYELHFASGEASPRGLRVKYQAARAYEINAALDAAVEAARAALLEANPGREGPTEEALSRFVWRAIQSAKYKEGAPTTARLEL